MTIKEVQDEVKRLTFIQHDLNYFYFDRELTELEIEAMKEIFPETKFSSRVSQSGFIFLAFLDDKNVRWRLNYIHLEKYIAANHTKGILNEK